MTSVIEPAAVRVPSLGGRLWSGVVAGWGAFTGVLPHVLHHVGPLAGAALLAGAGGKVIFFVLGLVAATPMLLRLHRRFRSWIAPAAATAIFAAMFTFSTLVVAPRLSGGSDAPALEQPGAPVPAAHEAHHRK